MQQQQQAQNDKPQQTIKDPTSPDAATEAKTTQMKAASPEAKSQLVAPNVGDQFIFRKNRKVEADNGARTVRIEAITEIQIDNELLQPGDQALVSEKTAQDFCKEYKMQYNFGGERQNAEAQRHMRVRAKRVAV